MNNNIIELKNATVIKENFTLLDSISLSIDNGEHTAIIGPNGSGKTTLLKLFTKDYYPFYTNKSYVKLFGKSNWDLFELRSKIGIVSDNLKASYNLNCTGIETILSGFFGSIGIYSTHKINETMKNKSNEIMDFLNISQLSDKTLSQMSSGEFNRFLVGRALVNDPDVLVLDEPTANLDIKSTYVFLSYISKIAKHGKTIIMVTHHIYDIIPEINRVIMLKNGKIFKDGKKKDILNSINISALFDFKIEIIKNNGHYNIKTY